MRRGSTSGTGLLLALLSAATFGTSGTFGAALLEAGWTPAAAVSARISIAALALTPAALVRLRGRWGLLRRGAPRVAAFGLIAVAGCQLFYFNAVAHLSVGVALLLEYLGTVLVVFWLWLRHGERPRRLTVVGGVLAVAGLGLVLDLSGTHRLDLVGVCWGLAAAAGLAVYFMLTSAAHDPLPPLVLAWGGLCVGALALVLLDLAGVVAFHAPLTDVTLRDHRMSWVVPVLGLSVVAGAFAYIAGIGAARRLGAKVASFLGLLEVLCAVGFAWLLLGQVPAMIQFAGGALILAGVALVRLDEMRSPQPAEQLQQV